MCLQIISSIYLKQDLALDNLQRLICNKTNANERKLIYVSVMISFED